MDGDRDGREPESHGTKPSARPEQPRASRVWGVHPAPRSAAGGKEPRAPDQLPLCLQRSFTLIVEAWDWDNDTTPDGECALCWGGVVGGGKLSARLSPRCWDTGPLGKSACGQACASLSVGGNGSYILFWWCKERFIFVALQSCVYSSLIPGIFSVLFWCPCWLIQWNGIASNASLPLWSFSLAWKMKLEGHHLKTDCPVPVCVRGAGHLRPFSEEAESKQTAKAQRQELKSWVDFLWLGDQGISKAWPRSSRPWGQ